jgi:hypothetical protein
MAAVTVLPLPPPPLAPVSGPAAPSMFPRPPPPPPPSTSFGGRHDHRTLLYLGLVGAAAIVAVVALATVPVSQSTVVAFGLNAAGANPDCTTARVLYSFASGSSVAFQWSSPVGQSVEFGVLDPNGNPVYDQQASSGTVQFVAIAGAYVFAIANCNSAPASVSVSGVATHTAPIL